MKTPTKGVLSILGAALILTFAAFPVLANDEGKAEKKDVDVTVTGFISDSMCGLDHSDMMKKHGGDAKFDDAACVQACVKGGAKYVLADREANKTYNLKDQKEVAKYAGKRVQIVGELKEDGTLDIHKVTLAP